MTNTDIDIFRGLSAQEYRERLYVFDQLMPELVPYIRFQAAMKAAKLPVSYVGEDDLVEMGHIEAWVAVLRWDGERSLVDWAKRLIWTRINGMFGRWYRKKRTARRVVQGQEVTSRPLPIEDVEGELAGESLDPAETLVAEEEYARAKARLLRRGERIEAAVLRLLVYPDDELLGLCEQDAMSKGRKSIRVTSSCIAMRLGVPTSRVTNAKVKIRDIFKELWE